MQFARCAAIGVVLLMASAAASRTETVTWTGWFSDQTCAMAHAKGGAFGPTNPDCAKQCLKKGIPAVFISEDAKAVYLVNGYSAITDDLGYHVRVVAAFDREAGSLTVQKVEQLSYEGAACSRRPKTASH